MITSGWKIVSLLVRLFEGLKAFFYSQALYSKARFLLLKTQHSFHCFSAHGAGP